MRIFLDTSIISAYFDTEKETRFKITVGWFDNEISNYEVFISNVVLDELRATKDNKLREKFFDFVTKNDMKLINVTKEIFDLAETYRKYVIPDEYIDSIHIATATLYNFDAIVSWNFKHIVNLETIKEIHEINRKSSLPSIEIVSLTDLTGGRYGSI